MERPRLKSSVRWNPTQQDYPNQGQSIRQFLSWSLRRLCNRLPPRDTDLSDRMKDEELALHYLYLRDEYGAGKLLTDAEMQM